LSHSLLLERIRNLEKKLQAIRILYRNTVDVVIRSHARDSELNSDSKLQTERDDFKLQTSEPFYKMALTTPGKARLVGSIPVLPWRVLTSGQLAKRIFYSFSKPGANYLVPEDIASYYLTFEDSSTAFAFFDKDGNGDVSREEMEATCLCVESPSFDLCPLIL
jgi:hypothetical protein